MANLTEEQKQKIKQAGLSTTTFEKFDQAKADSLISKMGSAAATPAAPVAATKPVPAPAPKKTTAGIPKQPEAIVEPPAAPDLGADIRGAITAAPGRELRSSVFTPPQESIFSALEGERDAIDTSRTVKNVVTGEQVKLAISSPFIHDVSVNVYYRQQIKI